MGITAIGDTAPSRRALTSTPRKVLRFTAIWAGAALFVVAIVAVFGLFRFGSIWAGVAYLGGDRVLLSPSEYSYHVKMPLVPEDGDVVVVFPFMIYNCTNAPIRVLGTSSTTCSCTTIDGVPAVIPPYGGVAIRARLRPRRIGRADAARVNFLTDSRTNPSLAASIAFRRDAPKSKGTYP